MRKSKPSGKKGYRPAMGSVLLLSAFICALVVLCITADTLEKRNGLRVDLSYNGITTQSETTKATLAALEHSVHIYALFAKGQEDAPLMELLDRYAAESDKVTWEQVDPGLNPAILTRYSDEGNQVESDSLIVNCPDTGRYRILSPADFVSLSLNTETGNFNYAGYTYEKALTSAIVFVTREEIPRVVIAQGHGELDGETLETFDRFLSENGYETVYEDISDSEYIPDPRELLVFFSPMRDINDEELEKINTFTGKGGSILFTCDYSDPISRMTNYRTLLRSFGIIPMEGIVVADEKETDTYYNQYRIDLIPEMLSTDITLKLTASGADTLLLPGCRAFESPEDSDRNLLVSTVLRSGSSSYLKQTDAETIERSEGDATGPFPLALEARRITSNGYISRAFAVGSSALLTEEQIYAMTDSAQFVIKVLDFLMAKESSGLDIAAKSALRPGLDPGSNRMGSVLVTALPIMVLFAAFAILLPRKYK